MLLHVAAESVKLDFQANSKFKDNKKQSVLVFTKQQYHRHL